MGRIVEDGYFFRPRVMVMVMVMVREGRRGGSAAYFVFLLLFLFSFLFFFFFFSFLGFASLHNLQKLLNETYAMLSKRDTRACKYKHCLHLLLFVS